MVFISGVIVEFGSLSNRIDDKMFLSHIMSHMHISPKTLNPLVVHRASNYNTASFCSTMMYHVLSHKDVLSTLVTAHSSLGPRPSLHSQKKTEGKCRRGSGAVDTE